MTKYNLAATTLATAVAKPAGSPSPGNDWNGSLGTVDLAKPLDYTGEEGKICFGTNNIYHLADTLAYLAYICAGKPADETVFDNAMGDTFTTKYWPLAAEAIARYRIYRLFHLANINPEFRAVDKAVWPIANAEVNARCERVGAETHAIALGTPEAETAIAESGREVLLSILACAIHRKLHEGHSWFTGAMSQPTSPTSKICGIAGADKKKFSEYMKRRGHDGDHHLSDSCIDKFAMVIGQVVDALVDSTLAGATTYCGEAVAGKNLKNIFFVGEATKNRYPPGVLGSGAIITGLALMSATVGDINTRAKIAGCGGLGANIGELDNAIKTKVLTHERMIKLTSDMGPSLAWVWGYASTAKLAEEANYVALAAHAKRYQAMTAAGKSCAQAMKRVTPHAQAMEASIANAIGAFATAVAAAASVNLGPASGPDMPLCSTLTAIDISKITAAVGKPGNTGGAGEVYYDADE